MGIDASPDISVVARIGKWLVLTALSGTALRGAAMHGSLVTVWQCWSAVAWVMPRG
jgi:hypothetical protein